MNTLCILIFLTLASFSFTLANDKIGYTYTLWIGDDASEKHFIHLNSDNGIKFIDAMNQAAAKDPIFSFEASDSAQFGKFVTKIAGQSQDISK